MKRDYASDPQELQVDPALRNILEGTSAEFGQDFFKALVKNLCNALGTYGAWVTEFLESCYRLRAHAFWLDGKFVEDFEYDVSGTPCQPVIQEKRFIHIPDKVVKLYPRDPDLAAVGAVSYMGVPLLDTDERVLGHLSVMDTDPMPEDPRKTAIFNIFSARAAAELRRLRAESELRAREKKLSGLVDSAMDAIIELDRELNISLVNTAAEKIFGCDSDHVIGRSFSYCLSDESFKKLSKIVSALSDSSAKKKYLWIPGGLHGRSGSGETLMAEATLSCYELNHKKYFLLILRKINDRIEAERKINELRTESRYLREELKIFHNFDEIIAQSRPMLELLRDVKQVAETDATVLLQGETGTGKELIASAIHNSSHRSKKVLIKVNCAAIPATLIESEFFGHEKGAFTGATGKREGRFTLADGGTIFLDEIAELPIDLQSKLLRVLQEGEFEPVGGTNTLKVDVRVTAATNRDLSKMVREGTFREDLYFRLNVFPLQIPPLREREDDIILLANTFIKNYSSRMGRTVEPLSLECIRLLKSYNWPGNVRELQNIIERAVITSRNGRLNLERALPEMFAKENTNSPISTEVIDDQIRTVDELRELERNNLIKALEKSQWKISGAKGAARLLGMKPTTLSSRLKALGIKRPD
ncbi:MAG: PAS domain S-box protein [candidate division Zixibacteria bacterium]|nr:PAS domain S-box protein [candidate division Zixibacteria bacterium]NIT51625.1 PAS domain S-box protein [candidate division Zixibacteria bacterium]NIU07989.1 PAS domain S-box protein [Phycisphaerae bacterium]NIW39497.1 PAS domain S-box protein [candidate division Zixibacteria bacterium]